MKTKVYNFIRKNHIFADGDSVLLGVSGGADSVCMLHLLWTLKETLHLRLSVVHVHHHIRGAEAQGDADFVRDLCHTLQVDFQQVDVDVPKLAAERGMTEEEAGRHARYETFFAQAKQCGANKIAVAHNLNDNSETVLFHLFRGTGIQGLTGIPVKREQIVRPLLCCSREEIEQYLAEHGLKYRTDSTNETTDYSRNKLRLQALPYIKENINQKAEYNIVNASSQLEEIADFLTQETDKAYAKYVRGNHLSEESFHLHPALLSMVVRRMIEEHAGQLKDITRTHINAVMELKNKTVSKQISLPYGLVAERTYEGICLRKINAGDSDREQTQTIGKNDSREQAQIIEKNDDREQTQKNEEQGSLQKTEIVEEPLIIDGKIYHNNKIEIVPEDGGFAKAHFAGNSMRDKNQDFPGENKANSAENVRELLYTKWLNYDKIHELTLRNRQKGDYIVIDDAGRKKKLKQYFIDEKIPRRERDKIWLLADGSNIVWIIGHRISAAYKVTEDTAQVIRVTYRLVQADGDTGQSEDNN